METALRAPRIPRAPAGLTSLVVKISARCNLACPYCYMFFHEDQSWRLRPAMMSLDVAAHVAQAIRRYCDRHERSISLSLHGGEPLLVGRKRFAEIVDLFRRVIGPALARVSVQTNGVLIDAEWARTLKALDVPVGVSLDGPAEIHDAARPDVKGRGSFDRVMAGIGCLQDVGKNPGILSVVAPGASGESAYRLFRSMGILDIAFLMPDATHDTKRLQYARVPRGAIAQFLIDAFEAWMDEDDPEVSLRPVIGLIRAMYGGPQETDAFGSPPLNYAIVDTDGSVETIDTLRICGEGVSHTGVSLLSDELDTLFADPGFVGQLFRDGPGVPVDCVTCPEMETCAGGYLPHRYSRKHGFASRSVWCDEILLLLGHLRQRLEIAQ
jgi:uncharacterized protein